jgi:hypothetical protein
VENLSQGTAVNRSTIVYILMLGVFAVGLWLILDIGSALLTPPEDLAGDWELSPLAGTGGDVQSLRVEQSGLFFTLSFTNGPSLHLKMLRDSADDSNRFGQKTLRLSGVDGEITLAGTRGSDQWRMTAVGKVRGDWTARLVNRTYPRPRSKTRPEP